MITSTSTLDKSLYRPKVLNLIKRRATVLKIKMFLQANGKTHQPHYDLASW